MCLAQIASDRLLADRLVVMRRNDDPQEWSEDERLRENVVASLEVEVLPGRVIPAIVDSRSGKSGRRITAEPCGDIRQAGADAQAIADAVVHLKRDGLRL